MKYLVFLLFLWSIFFTKNLSAQTYDWSAIVNAGNLSYAGALARDVVSDKWGNVITVGTFKDTLDFDPDTSVYQLPLNYYGTGAAPMIYIQKLDSVGNFLWAKTLGTGLANYNNYYCWDLEVDIAGNIYFVGRIGYGWWEDVPDSTPVYIAPDVTFVLKLNKDGEYLWHKTFHPYGGTVYFISLELDEDQNMFMTGNFQGMLDFNPSPGLYQMNAGSVADVFICKWDSLGDFEWAKQVESEFSLGLDLTPEGDVIFSGEFRDSLDADPGSSEHFIYNLDYEIGSFISKLDSDGNFQWVRHVNNTNRNFIYGYIARDNTISIDSLGNIYSSIGFGTDVGVWSDTVYYDPFNLNLFYHSNYYSWVILKYDESGNLIWSRLFSNLNSSSGIPLVDITGIETDKYGNVYVCGHARGDVYFGDDSLIVVEETYQTNYSRRAIFAKLVPDGDLAWAVGIEQDTSTYNGDSYILGLHITDNGKLIAAGSFHYEVDLDPGPDSVITSGKGALTYVLDVCNLTALTENIDTVICNGDSIWLEGAYQNLTGEYLDTVISPFYECFDTTVYVTTLTVLDTAPIIQIDTFICYGDSIVLENEMQSSTGFYWDTIFNNLGCDSIIYHTHLTILDPYQLVQTDSTICFGDTLLIGQQYQNQSGVYYSDTLHTTNGCDSIIYSTNLTVIPTPLINTTYTSLCYGDSLLINGSWEYLAGLYHLDTIFNQNECDSIVYDLVLNFSGPLQYSTLDTVICYGEIVQIGTQSFDSSGYYLLDTLLTQLGCDSLLLSLNLTIEDAVYSIDRDTTICEGDDIFLGGGWQNEEYIYVDTIYSITGCDSAIVYTDLSIQEGFILDFGLDLDLCNGEEYELNPSLPNATYLWQDGSTDSIFSITETGYYWVEMTIGACIERDTVYAYFYAPPTFSFSDDTLLCEGEILELSALTLHAVYEWQDGSDEYYYEVNSPGLYWVEVHLPGCGSYRDSIEVAYWETPKPSLGGDTTLCEGDILILDVSSESGSILWQDGSTDPVFTVTETGNYSVTVSNEYCEGTDIIHVNYLTSPIFNLGSDTVLCNGASLNLNFTDSTVDYLWQDGNSTGWYSIQSPGLYWLEQSNICGVFRDSIQVIYDPCHPNISMPNVFSPNDDGINDVFHPVHLQNVQVFSFTVYDRWGIQVHQQKDGEIKWDGQYQKSNSIKQGTYFWVMKYSGIEDGELLTKKGTIQLMK